MSPAKPGASRRLLVLLVGLAAAVAVIDQVTKEIALATLDEGVRVPVLGDLLGWQLWFNPGAAFSIGTGTTWLFTLIMVVVIVVILRYARRLGSVSWTIALGLLLGGAVGNLIDRLFRDPSPFQGHVVDFIAYYDWFIGNVADIGIVVAALLICVLALTGREIDGTRLRDAREGGDDDAGAEEHPATHGSDEDRTAATDAGATGRGSGGTGNVDDGDEQPDWLVAAQGSGSADADADADDDPEAWWDRRLAGTPAAEDTGDASESETTATHGSTAHATATRGSTVDQTATHETAGDAVASDTTAAAPDATGTAPATATSSGERITRRELRRRREAAEAAARAGTDGAGA